MDGSSISNEPSVTSLTAIIEGQFPIYLVFGMTAEQYWDADPFLVKYYREAYEIRNKELRDQLWLQGMYNYIGVTVAISHALDKHSKAEYPDSPNVEKKSEEQTQDDIIAKLQSFQAHWEQAQGEENAE